MGKFVFSVDDNIIRDPAELLRSLSHQKCNGICSKLFAVSIITHTFSGYDFIMQEIAKRDDANAFPVNKKQNISFAAYDLNAKI